MTFETRSYLQCRLIQYVLHKWLPWKGRNRKDYFSKIIYHPYWESVAKVLISYITVMTLLQFLMNIIIPNMTTYDMLGLKNEKNFQKSVKMILKKQQFSPKIAMLLLCILAKLYVTTYLSYYFIWHKNQQKWYKCRDDCDV